MPRALVVIGLCGSGKSHVIAERGLKPFDGLCGTPALLDEAIAWLNGGHDCGIEEIHYCIPGHRDAFERRLRAEVPGVEIEYLCFANDLAAANWNVTHRLNKAEAESHRGINAQLHPLYVPPAGATLIPIHRVSRS